jgi:hypothetical protein
MYGMKQMTSLKSGRKLKYNKTFRRGNAITKLSCFGKGKTKIR